MRARSQWPKLVGIAAGLLAVSSLAAAERVHTVVTGESAASLAKKYYGERSLGDLLLRYNGKPGAVIRPGQKLTIPYCEVYRARPGDSWSGLAKRHLGRAGAAPTLAELNGYDAGQPLRVGARIVLPVVLRHNLARGETLSSIAERVYGDPHKATMLQEFSRIDDVKRLSVGTPLEIPIVGFVRIETEPASVATALPPAAVERRFVSELAAAVGSFTDGDYDRAREMLESQRERVASEGTATDRREWSQLLAYVYIALDRDAEACTAYRTGTPADAQFDPDLVSPRIRAVLSNCAQLDNPGPAPQIPPHAGTGG